MSWRTCLLAGTCPSDSLPPPRHCTLCPSPTLWECRTRCRLASWFLVSTLVPVPTGAQRDIHYMHLTLTQIIIFIINQSTVFVCRNIFLIHLLFGLQYIRKGWKLVIILSRCDIFKSSNCFFLVLDKNNSSHLKRLSHQNVTIFACVTDQSFELCNCLHWCFWLLWCHFLDYLQELHIPGIWTTWAKRLCKSIYTNKLLILKLSHKLKKIWKAEISSSKCTKYKHKAYGSKRCLNVETWMKIFLHNLFQQCHYFSPFS